MTATTMWTGLEDLRGFLRPLETLTLDPRNARKHPKENIDAIKKSLDTFGQHRPAIIAGGRIIIGNGMLIAAKELGWTHLAAMESGDDEAQAVMRGLMDNKSALTAEWDFPVLRDILADIDNGERDMDATGFLEREREQIAIWAGNVGPKPTPVSLFDRFVVPPFSVLDARQGYWQERKARWLALGIKSEMGRGNDADKTKRGLRYSESSQPSAVYNKKNKLEMNYGRKLSWEEFYRLDPMAAAAGGTSIFDPVLSELAYRWFCPPGGAVLDPFAGGSVRGIVAAMLGRQYVGIDLRAEQVAANEEQARAILNAVPVETRPVAKPIDPAEPAAYEVKISAAQARQQFNGCDPDYIRDVCHASCCRSSTAPTGTMITIHETERAQIEARGAVVSDDGFLRSRPGEKKCPFESETHLCGLHGTPDKPFGCIASPFTLNASNTLIVRNRYRLLKCYKDGKKIPAYKAFAASLVKIFGTAEAARITTALDAGEDDIRAHMPAASYRMLQDNDAAKHARTGHIPVATSGARPIPKWAVGDAMDVLTSKTFGGEFDLVFTCPPYGDLEQYSEDPRDLSNMEHAEFVKAYRGIIAVSITRLKKDRFACIVVGDYRDDNGVYRDFVSETIDAFRQAGAALYNEAVLLTAVSSASIRAGRQFAGSRKLAKCHQNVIVFVKGDPKRATEACGVVEISTGETEGGKT